MTISKHSPGEGRKTQPLRPKVARNTCIVRCQPRPIPRRGVWLAECLSAQSQIELVIGPGCQCLGGGSVWHLCSAILSSTPCVSAACFHSAHRPQAPQVHTGSQDNSQRLPWCKGSLATASLPGGWCLPPESTNRLPCGVSGPARAWNTSHSLAAIIMWGVEARGWGRDKGSRRIRTERKAGETKWPS
jgi:hypothetical protein